MPSDVQWSHLLLVGLLGIIVILEEWLRRRPTHARRDATARAMGRPQERQVAAVLLTPFVVLGAVWLIPWAAALASSGPAALLPGLLIVVPLLACLRRALADRESDE